MQTADQSGWAMIPVAFTAAQAAEVRRALAAVCADAPKVEVGEVQVVRSVADEAYGTVTLTLKVAASVPGGRVMIVSVSDDLALGNPDATLNAWSALPAGGGSGEVTWTFSCTANPQPPSLDVRFVGGVRATPLRLPLDQEALAPWVGEACPLLTPATLVDSGWTLP